MYIGQTARAIKTRYKEHQRNIGQHQPEKLAVVEYSISTGHCIESIGTSLLHRISGQVDRLVKKAIEIGLNKNNFKRDEDFILSQARPLTADSAMKVKAGPSIAGI